MFDVVELVQSFGVVTPFALGITLGIVDWLGKLGVKGKWQLFSSLVTGLLVGGSLVYFLISPQALAEWFSVGLYGLIVGLTASGVYNATKTAAEKGYVAAASKLEK